MIYFSISVEKNLTQSMVKTMVASGKLKTRGQKKGTNYFSAVVILRPGLDLRVFRILVSSDLNDIFFGPVWAGIS
jgi:hypothetical protein